MGGKIYRAHLSTASDARAVRTRQALRAAMLQLLEAKPLDRITIRDICASAGIGYTTFFRHHPTKEVLLDDVAAEEIRRLVTLALPLMDVRRAKPAARALCVYIDEHRALWTTLLIGGAAGAIRKELLRIALELAPSWTPPNAWPPTDLAISLLVGGTIEVLAWWLKADAPASIDDVADILDQVVIAPVLRGRQKAGRTTRPRARRKRLR